MRLRSLIPALLVAATALSTVDLSATNVADEPASATVHKRGRSKAGTKSAKPADKNASKPGKAAPAAKNTDKSKRAGGNANKRKGAKAAGKEAAPAGNYYALKVNVPYAVAVVQNLEFEMQVSRQWSVALPVMWSFSDLTDRHGLRTIAFQPEARLWTGSAGRGHFFGAHLNLAWYNLKWNDTRYQARHTPLMGAGISYGYKLPISDHWGAEFSVGAGYVYTKYNKFYNIANGARIGSASRNYFGFDRVVISLVYSF